MKICDFGFAVFVISWFYETSVSTVSSKFCEVYQIVGVFVKYCSVYPSKVSHNFQKTKFSADYLISAIIFREIKNGVS